MLNRLSELNKLHLPIAHLLAVVLCLPILVAFPFSVSITNANAADIKADTVKADTAKADTVKTNTVKADGATVSAGQIIPPPVDCLPYNPPSSAPSYNVDISGFVGRTTGWKYNSDNLRAYLYAVPLYKIDITGENYTPAPAYSNSIYKSIYVPGKFECVNQGSVDSKWDYSFMNQKIKYAIPDKPDLAQYDTANKITDKRVLFMVRVHDQSGTYVDGWGVSALLGKDDLSPIQFLGSAQSLQLQMQQLWQLYYGISKAYPNFYSGAQTMMISQGDKRINPYFYSGAPDDSQAEAASAWAQFYCYPSNSGSKNPTCDAPPFAYDSAYLYPTITPNDSSTIRAGLSRYVDTVSNNAADLSGNFLNGIVSNNGKGASGTLDVDLITKTNAPDPSAITFPTLKVGDTFDSGNSNLSCFNTKKQPLQKVAGSNTKYLITNQDFNTQIYCSLFTKVDIADNSHNPNTTLANAMNFTYNNMKNCVIKLIDPNAPSWLETDITCSYPGSSYEQNIKPMHDASVFTYESQSNLSSPVTAGPAVIPDTGAFEFNNGKVDSSNPKTGESSVVRLDKCTIVSGACKDDPKFNFDFLWSRWESGAWKQVSNSATYTPQTADWGNPDDKDHFGKMQVTVNYSYGKNGDPDFNLYSGSHSEIVGLNAGDAPPFNFELSCQQTNDNKSYYTDGTCATGDTIYANVSPPAGFTVSDYQWHIKSADQDIPIPNSSNLSQILITPELVNSNSKCVDAFKGSTTDSCSIYLKISASSIGYNPSEGVGNPGELAFKPGIPPTNFTPAFIYPQSNHPVITEPLLLTGLYNPEDGFGSSCDLFRENADGTETKLKDWYDCSPGSADFDYVPVSDDYGLKLKVGVKTVNAILPAAYLSYGTAADSLLAKYIISEKVDKGDPLPADTLKFDPNYKDAKVGSLLDVIGVPSDWQLKPGSCKITLSDGTDVTGSIYAKCDDKQISYIPNADDLKKSVTFSGIWTKEHFNDSALSIKSGVIQKGDGVRAPLEITGLLENNMTVYLDGIDLHDWKLSTCKLYKTKAGEADGFIQDCVEQKDRQFRIDSNLVGYSLKLETSYTRDGYNDGSGEYTSSVITPGDYPYPTQLSMISNASSEQGNLIRVNNQVLATGIPDDSTGWKSEINWQLCSANCEDQSAVWTNAGETSQLYMPLVDNLGKFLRVTAHVTKLGYNPTDLYSEPSEILPSTDPVFDPQIVGDLNVNQVLTAVNIPYADGVHWSDISYKWFSKNPGTFVIEELTNFKDRQIIIDKSLLGLQLMVEVTAKNDDQGVITKSSVWTNPVSQGQLPTFRASIIGDPKVNSQLLVQGLPPKETGWDTAEYQWFITVGENPDIYNPIVGQTDPYYRIGPDALGKRVLVRVTLSSSDGSFTPIEDFEYAGTDDSNPKGQLIAKGEPTDFTPTLLGQDSMNSLLSVQGILDPAEYDSTYQWQRCTNACDSSNNWTNILNATQSTYRSAKADVGNQVRAEVTATHKTLGDAYDSSIEYTDSKLIKKAGGIQFKPALSGDFVVNSIISAVGFPNSDWKIDQCVWHLYNTQSQLVRTVQGVPTDNINGCRPYIISSLDLGLRAQLTAHAYHITDSDYYEDGTGSSDVSAQIAKANLPDFSLSLATPGKVGSSVVALGVPLTIDGATFEYNWQKQETPTSKPINVSNSSDDFLIITPDFYNYYLALTVKISIPGYNDYYATAQTTSKVALGDPIGFTPSILGLPKIGEQLVPGNLPDPTLGWTLSYSWITDDGKKVSDNRIYEPGVDDVGKNIAVEVKASRTGYADSIVKSENVGPVIGGDSISFTPNIGGLDSEKNAKIGSALQALDMPDISTGWTVNYAWYYFDSAASTYTKIANSDNKDYMPGVSEIDKTIALGATATRPGYIDSVAYSEPAKVVKANFPDYTADFGTDAKVDSALQIKFSPELDTSDANSATYQWYLANDETADGNIISSAITDNYMVPESDQGKYIYAKITLSKPGFNDKVLATSRDFISETIDPTFTPAFLDASNNEFGRILTLDPASLLQSPYEFSHMALYAQVGDTPNPGSDYYISGVVTPSVALDDPFVLGKKVYAKVVMTDPGTKAVVGQTASFGPIVNGEIPDFTPVISNTSPKVDDILSVSGLPAKSSTDSAASPDFEYLYKWMASGDLVSTDSQYKVTGADVGKTITVEVTVLRDCYNSKAAVSAPTSVVLEGAIVDFSPYLVGSFVVGEGAITVDGIVSGYNQAYEVQMCSNPADESTCAALNPQPAFTGNSFALTDNMIGQNIRVKVTLSKQYYEDSVAYTSISGKVHDADALKDFQPTIAGTPKVGDVISAAGQITEVDPITGNPIDYKYTYQWQESSDGVTFTNINGATDINYKIPVAAYAENESGQPSGYLRVQVTVSRDSYADVARFSNFEIVQKGDIPFDANEVKYCSGNLSGDINVVYRVDIPLSVCGLPKNFSDSQFSTDYKWYIADSVDSQAPVLVSSDATYTPIVSDVNKFLITKIHVLADGYNDKEIVVNSGANKVAKGEAVDLSSATLNNFSPKVADTIRLMGLPQNGWQITYQVYDAQVVSTPLYKCTFTDQAQCRDSFSVTPNMYDKQLSVVIEAKRNGYETSNATLPFTNLVGKGNPIDFSPVIAPRSGENIKVDSVLEIQGVPKVGDTSLPFNDFTVDYSWIDQADHLVSDRAVFTPDPSLAGQDLKCEIIVKSVGFEDSIENCLAVRVDLGNKISLQGAFINGVFQSKHFLTLEGFPDITEGWALDTVIWYSCKNLNDSPDQCNTLSSVVNQFPDYSKNPPSFELTDSQVGMFIKAYIKFTKGGFLDSDAVLSAPNAVAVGAPPYFQPEITNGGKVGDRLVALGAPSEFSGWLPKYQWFANGKVIPNNRGSDFVPTSDYLGKNISVSITIYNPNPGYENMSVTKKSSTVNIGLGSSLTAGVNGYNPKIVYYPGFIYSYYLIHGSQAGSLGWQESVSWRESGRIVPGEINNYWVVDSQQNNVSAVLDLSRPGYKSNQITVHE